MYREGALELRGGMANPSPLRPMYGNPTQRLQVITPACLTEILKVDLLERKFEFREMKKAN